MNRVAVLLSASLLVSLSACAPIAQLVKPPAGTSQASVRFSPSGIGAVNPSLSNFSPDRVEAFGQATPALSGGTGQLTLPSYSTQLVLSLGSGTPGARTVIIQVSEKLSSGFSCTLGGLPTVSLGVVKVCALSYRGGQQLLEAVSGTFSVTGLEGKTLRFVAQATLNTPDGGARLDLDGRLDGFTP